MPTTHHLRKIITATGFSSLLALSPLAFSGQLTSPVDTLHKLSTQISFPLTMEVTIEIDEHDFDATMKRLNGANFPVINTKIQAASDGTGKRCWVTLSRQHIKETSALDQAIADVTKLIGSAQVGESNWTLRPDLVVTTVTTHS